MFSFNLSNRKKPVTQNIIRDFKNKDAAKIQNEKYL